MCLGWNKGKLYIEENDLESINMHGRKISLTYQGGESYAEGKEVATGLCAVGRGRKRSPALSRGKTFSY